MRQIILVIAGILILGGAIMLNKYLGSSKKAPPKVQTKNIASVFTSEVRNSSVPVQVATTGTVLATNRIELYSEVQGLMIEGSRRFKPGVAFHRGETLMRINADDFRANVQSQKSNLQNLITAALPDLRLDFADAYPKWDKYLREFDINKPVAALPEPGSDKEKFFITGRNIYSTYYTVRNAEITLNKYSIRAPYNGILTESLVDPGTLIRPGQKLGSYINPGDYELEASVSSAVAKRLKVGAKVTVNSTTDKVKTYNGKIVRINKSIDPSSQTVNIYIGLQGEGIEEGMFLEAVLDAFNVEDAIEINRSLLLDNNEVYIVKDSTLVLQRVETIYFGEENAVVKGVENGTLRLTKIVPGAYPGMKVNTIEDKAAGA